MNDFLIRTLAWFTVAWAGYLVLSRLASWVTRPRRISPVPATPDLPAEPPPAVVGLLVNDGRVDPDAAVATLIDLAARHYLELYQPASDHDETLVRVRDRAPADLTPYERRVMDRVVASADASGAVPLHQLAGHYAEDGYQWAAQFDKEVTADAKERKLLSQPPDGLSTLMTVIGLLLCCATGAFLPTLVVPVEGEPSTEPAGTAFAIAYLVVAGVLGTAIFAATVIPLSRWAERPHRTAAGKELTARWLGVAEWLRDHGSAFTELPPAAVTVWDRYLSYGAALGVTPVVSRAADLAVGARQVLWSNYGGSWREIRVTYPGRGRRSGYPPVTVIVNSVLGLALVAALGWLVQHRWHLTGSAAIVAVLVVSPLVVRWLYRIGRAALDGLRPIEFTGRVLVRTGMPHLLSLSDMEHPPPAFVTRRMTRARQPYFVIVDDGRSPVTPVWTVYPAWRNAGQCEVGDIVRLRGYRWCRYARRVRVLDAGHATATGALRNSA